MQRRENMMVVATLKKERGWTDKLIRHFLGDPDELATNPHHRSGPPMRLYCLDRIEQTEQRADFREAWEKIAQQRDEP
jgi:hypothetical protein